MLTVRSAGLHGDLLGETTESGTCWESLIRACATVWSRSARWTPRNRRMGMVEGGRRPGRGSTVRSPSSHRPKIHTRQTLSALSCHQCDRNDIFQQHAPSHLNTFSSDLMLFESKLTCVSETPTSVENISQPDFA